MGIFGLNSPEIQKRTKKLDQMSKEINAKWKRGESGGTLIEEYKTTLLELGFELDKLYGHMNKIQTALGGGQINKMKERILKERKLIDDTEANLKIPKVEDTQNPQK